MAGNHDIERLSQLHAKILDLYVQGMRNVDIARELGLRENSVSRICAAPVFQDQAARRRKELEGVVKEAVAAVATRQAELRERVVDGGIAAAKTLTTLLDSGSENVKLHSARELLRGAFALEGSGAQPTPSPLTQINIAQLQLALRESVADQRALPEDEETQA